MSYSSIQKPALFLDRDGVINRKIENAYVRNMEELDFLDGAVEAIRSLNQYFYPVVIVTNQQGIGKRIMTVWDLEILHLKMIGHLESCGAQIHQDYFCPHLASANCYCRKPKTGMLHQAIIDFPFIRKERSWMVGDSDSDIEAALGFGIKAVRLAETEDPRAHFSFRSLQEFAHFIESNASQVFE